MANVFFTPHYIITGENALSLSKEYLADMGKRALIVTDDFMVQFGNVKKVTDILDSVGITYAVYSKINGEPNDTMIDAGVEIYKNEKCDFLIGVGGGSPIDSMKAIGAVLSNGGNICDYMGKVISKPIPPTCAIPTTAGTGSEATQFTIINNTKENIKMLLKGPVLMSKLAIIDPTFTMTAPAKITAATGLDALCHAVEAYTSTKAFAMSDTYALSAVKRIFESLYECYVNGSNTEARTNMAIAALEAGIAFNNASVTIIHGMSRPIGALYHVPHGLSNAMLLDKCLRFAVSGAYDRFCDLAKAIGIYKDGMSAQEGAEAFIEAVGTLCKKLEIQTPAEFGIDKEDFFSHLDKMAQDALDSGSPQNTRRSPSKEEIIAIYQSLFE